MRSTLRPGASLGHQHLALLLGVARGVRIGSCRSRTKTLQCSGSAAPVMNDLLLFNDVLVALGGAR